MSDTSAAHEKISCDLSTVYLALQHFSLPTWLKLDVSMAQFKALVVVERTGDEGISVTAVGNKLEIGESSASLLIEQLVKRGYAQRTPDPADRRRVLVTVTGLGRDLVAELRHGKRQHLDGWLMSLSDEDAAALEQGLHALAGIARREISEAKKNDER